LTLPPSSECLQFYGIKDSPGATWPGMTEVSNARYGGRPCTDLREGPDRPPHRQLELNASFRVGAYSGHDRDDGVSTWVPAGQESEKSKCQNLPQSARRITDGVGICLIASRPPDCLEEPLAAETRRSRSHPPGHGIVTDSACAEDGLML
jgi:hypothetical protein